MDVIISGGGVSLTPSEYTGKISSDEDGTTFEIATGATRLLLQSLEVTTTAEYAVIAFGSTASNAQANLSKTGITPNIISNSGAVIRSGLTDVVQAPELLLNIPANATHAAIGNGVAGAVQVIMVTQGK